MSRITIGILAFSSIVFLQCVRGDDQSHQAQQTSSSSYWHFSLEDQNVVIGGVSDYSYMVSEDIKEVNSSSHYRLFNLETNKVLFSNDKIEPVKYLDNFYLESTSQDTLEVVRYIYGMGIMDGLNLVGFTKSRDRVLYVINTTSHQGVIDSAFYQKHEGRLNTRLFTLNLKPPPQPMVVDTL